MRDPNRIFPNWQKIAALHSQFPDWRMGQFLENVFGAIAKLQGAFSEETDIFYFEDNRLIDLFTKAVESLKGGKS